MRVFIKQAYLVYKGLFGWLNWQGYISNVILRPMLMVIMFALLGRFAINAELAQRFALGMSTMGAMYIIANGIGQSYMYERQRGTLAFLFVSPVNRLSNYLTRGVFHFHNGLIAFACGLIAAWLIAGINFDLLNWGAFIITAIITTLALIGFGQFVGILVLLVNDWWQISGVTIGLVTALSGVIIPTSTFPGAVQEFTKLLPMTNGLSAIRETFAGATLSGVWLSLLREVITDLVYLALGYIGFVYFERRVKGTGTLDEQME